MPACLTGHAPLLLQLSEGGEVVDRVVGDGHPDYASSYGLFTLDTKQYSKQGIAPQQQKPCSLRMPVGFVSSYNFENGHVFLWSLTWPCGTDQSGGRVRSGQSERKKKKIISPFAIFNLATPKVVVIYGILRYIKVNSLFYGIIWWIFDVLSHFLPEF